MLVMDVWKGQSHDYALSFLELTDTCDYACQTKLVLATGGVKLS